MEELTFHVKDLKSAEELAEELNGFEAKSIYLYSKEAVISNSWDAIIARFTQNKILRCARLLKLYWNKIVSRYHTVFMTYNVHKQITAYLYGEWQVAVDDGRGMVLRKGELEKIYRKLEVDVEEDTRHIWIWV